MIIIGIVNNASDSLLSESAKYVAALKFVLSLFVFERPEGNSLFAIQFGE